MKFKGIFPLLTEKSSGSLWEKSAPAQRLTVCFYTDAIYLEHQGELQTLVGSPAEKCFVFITKIQMAVRF